MLRLPNGAIDLIVDEVRTYGARLEETGGFLLSPSATPEKITTVAFAGQTGITRGWGRLGISGTALAQLFTWADETELRVAAQFHSHGRHAFLSPTDLRHGLNVRGFTTCVVPFFQTPPHDPREWGWWKFDGHRWHPETAPAIADGTVETVIFDERGVVQ